MISLHSPEYIAIKDEVTAILGQILTKHIYQLGLMQKN